MKARGVARAGNVLEPYGYIAPAIIILGTFHVLPIVYVVWLSLTNGTAASIFGGAWVGLSHYHRLFTDPEISESLRATVLFTLGTVPVGAAIALGLAMLLLDKIPGRGLFRTLILLPFITPVVATTIVWQWIFNPQYGFLDSVLYTLHLPTVDWFTSPFWSMVILCAYSIWHEVGFTVLIMLAGLSNIDKEVREAARIDGANGWREFVHITIPLMSPWILFVVVVNVIGAFKVFTQVLTLTNGGPNHATDIAGFVIEQVAFQFGDLPYAATISTAVLLLVSGLTVLQFTVSRRTIFYQ
ncbi:MAG: sugar ABC transporter permease [Chloroflexota bacterium]